MKAILKLLGGDTIKLLGGYNQIHPPLKLLGGDTNKIQDVSPPSFLRISAPLLVIPSKCSFPLKKNNSRLTSPTRPIPTTSRVSRDSGEM